MHLSRPLYESLPLVYALIGAAAVFIAYLDPAGGYGAVAFGLGFAAETAALTVFLRRRDHRELSREYLSETIELPSNLER